MENYVSQKYFVLTEAIDFIYVYRKKKLSDSRIEIEIRQPYSSQMLCRH